MCHSARVMPSMPYALPTKDTKNEPWNNHRTGLRPFPLDYERDPSRHFFPGQEKKFPAMLSFRFISFRYNTARTAIGGGIAVWNFDAQGDQKILYVSIYVSCIGQVSSSIQYSIRLIVTELGWVFLRLCL